MLLIFKFARFYPRQSLLTLLFIILAGIVEGIGMTALLPLLQTAINPAAVGKAGSAKSTFISSALASAGIPMTVGSLLMIMLCGAVFSSILILIADRYIGYTVSHVATDLRLSLLRALLATRWGHFLKQQVGSMANAAGTEAMRASTAYLHAATALAMSIQAIAYFIVALLVSWQTTLCFMAAGSFVVLLLNRMVRQSKKAGRKQTKLLQSLLARLSDNLQSLKAFKSMGREYLADEILSTDTLKLNKAMRQQVFSRAALRGIQEPLMTLVVIIGVYIMLVYLKKDLSETMVLIFLMARMLNEAGKAQRKFQEGATCESAYWSIQEKINDALQHKEPSGGEIEVFLEHGIVVDRVDFGYDDQLILENASLEIPSGTFTSIVGPSGAGKTTLIDLITGLFQPTRGQILIDGVPLAEINLQGWRQQIGYVPQETILLHESILTNVTLGEPSLTAADAEYALKAAGAWDFVSMMPEGAATIVGERGTRLSGGQRQRIAIARALIHRPRLLILDEATSALDPETATAICQTLRGLRGQLTILAISHQAALVEVADLVFRISEGNILQVTRQQDNVADATSA